MGNLWRFDLTSATETTWGGEHWATVLDALGSAITTAVTVSSGGDGSRPGNTIMIAFGTGQRTQFTNAAPVAFQAATQSLYGVWDWNMSSWNAKSTTQYAFLAPTATGLTGPTYSVQQTNLQHQTFVVDTTDGHRDIKRRHLDLLAGSITCSATPQFGWYLNLAAAWNRSSTTHSWCRAFHGELDRAGEQPGELLCRQ